jgi:hypothetical protein
MRDLQLDLHILVGHLCLQSFLQVIHDHLYGSYTITNMNPSHTNPSKTRPSHANPSTTAARGGRPWLPVGGEEAITTLRGMTLGVRYDKQIHNTKMHDTKRYKCTTTYRVVSESVVELVHLHYHDTSYTSLSVSDWHGGTKGT